VAFMGHHLKIDDFDTWKSLFDADPVGRKQAAKGHIMPRGVDNPNEVFTRVEFDSVEDAKSFRDRLVASGVLDGATVLTPPTVAELVDVLARRSRWSVGAHRPPYVTGSLSECGARGFDSAGHSLRKANRPNVRARSDQRTAAIDGYT